MLTRSLCYALTLLLVACSEDARRPSPDAGSDPRDSGVDLRDAGTVPDASPVTDMSQQDTDPAPDLDPLPCLEPPAAPTERLWPTPGELYYLQQGLGGFSLGEAAIVIGPEGHILLIDVGNDSHDDDVLETLDALIDRMNQTPGFPTRPPRTVDAIVLTHFHADHTDGIEDLLGKVRATRVVHRGFVDLTEAANRNTAQKLCGSLHETATMGVELCASAAPGCVDGVVGDARYPSLACDGLWREQRPDMSWLGDTASMTLLAANATINGRSFEQDVEPLSTTESNAENARSVVGVLAHGDVRLLFNGDLTGGGKGTADVESFLLQHVRQVSDLDGRGVDVLHLGHHGRETSSSKPWLDALLPNDGCDRNAVMGISTAHLGSPEAPVLERLFEGERLRRGFGWSTLGHGDTTPGHRTAEGGSVILRTTNGGTGYVLQTIDDRGAQIESAGYLAARLCPRACP